MARAAGRPRSERAERAILTATIELVASGMTVSEVSIEAIAARAGVGKTTIYRWWSNKEDLVADALATLKTPVPPLAGRSVREDLIALLDVMRIDSANVDTRCVMNIAMSESDRYPELFAKFRKRAIEPRRRAIVEVLGRGARTGELRADIDVTLAMASLTGGMLWHTKWAPDKGDLPADLAARIVDQILAGLAG